MRIRFLAVWLGVQWGCNVLGQQLPPLQPQLVKSGPEPQVPEGGQPPGPYPSDSVTAANWVAKGGPVFDGTVSVGLEGQGPIPWCVSRYNRGDFAVRLNPRDSLGAQNKFGNLLEFVGTGLGNIPEEQAWRPSSQAGIIIPSVRINGPIDWKDGQGLFYPVIAASASGSSGYGYSMVDGTFGKGDVDIQTGKAGNQSGSPSPEGNFNFATAWFPYAQGWTGGGVGNPTTDGQTQWEGVGSHSPGLTPGVVSWPEYQGRYGGVAVVSLPRVNSLADGLLFTTSTHGESTVNLTSAAPKADGSGWVVSVREASTTKPLVLATNQSQFQFVYIPYASRQMMGGHIAADGGMLSGRGHYTLNRTSTGIYGLTIPGKTGAQGVLLLQSAGFLAGTQQVAGHSFLSYQYRDHGSDSSGIFVIQARRVEAGNRFPLVDADFYFLWVDFRDPLAPPNQGLPTDNNLQLNLRNADESAMLTWSSQAKGATLEMTGKFGVSETVWTPVGVIGEGILIQSYQLPVTSKPQFYRLRR